MRLNAVKLFDSSHLDPETAQKIEPLVQYINQQFDAVITALQRNITFADNMRCETRQISLESGVPKRITVSGGGAAVIGAVVLRPPTDRLLTGFTYKLNGNDVLEVTASYSVSGKADITLVVFYA